MLETDRLILRHWRPEDSAPFAALNADPRVMEYMGGSLDRAGSDAFAARIDRHFTEYGFGLYAAERKAQPGFIGFVGLQHVNFDTAFTPAVEIGWRLAAEHWNQGYASEAARRVRDHAFADLQLPDIVFFTYTGNAASRRVMEKIGMRRDPREDFRHPRLPPDHPLMDHVLYRCAKNI